MSAHPLFHPSFIPTHLFNRSTIKFQLAWHAKPSKSPQAYIITRIHDIRARVYKANGNKENIRTDRKQKEASPSHLSQSSMPRCRQPVTHSHPRHGPPSHHQGFPQSRVLLCSFPHEVVPFSGFSSFFFLSRCRPAMPLEVVPDAGVFLLEVVPLLGVFLHHVHTPPSRCRPALPLEVVPDGGFSSFLRLSPTAGFSSFLRLSPTAGFSSFLSQVVLDLSLATPG
ncbi:hypothetical protein PAPYR_12424 [Paratrimastix pyriformis]|uniref:Uncharacterized protein n=1 Tax=Paratrimastix pyriformis TaxID=342808 RepID=A0ABQ8U796_9EUKA|nr:hypothetical protein PAPYR_12424 [Paratrimastix pyriformis]